MLARKEELLKEMKYYEKRIDDARIKMNNNSFYDESSDSEVEFTVELEPSISELKLKQSMLQTCLFATQELTGVQILQSEVNIMVNEPVFEKEPPVKEAGVWKEVTAECRVDLVPFSMTFYVHHPKRLFGSPQYRCLQVTPVKTAHEQELMHSVLPSVKTPSDAVEVVGQYARAHRSRRSTLARLAERYADALFMEPMPEGGYILKCANLLEVSWTLQNKRSPISPFHHRLKFDLEYMDESYVKIITQAHRQLSDPAVETDERTLLLAKIINTCLQARKDMPVTESESDTDKLTDQNAETNAKDSEIMAPPKTIPKKVKPNKKRPIEDGGGTSKRAKIDNKENFNDYNTGRDEDLNSMIEKSDLKSKNSVSKAADKVKIKKSMNPKNDGSTKESKNSYANSNIASKSNCIDSKRTAAKDGNTDSKKEEDSNDKDLNNENVIKKSKISSKTDKKDVKENKSSTINDKNSKDQTSAKNENKNSVASSKNEKDNLKNKKAKSKKDTTEVRNDINSKSETVISKNDKNNLKEKDVSNTIENNEKTNNINSKSENINSKNNKDNLKNKNVNNKKNNKEIANDMNSKSGSVTSKNDKNNLNNKDINNKMNKKDITNETNLKDKDDKSKNEITEVTNEINSKSDNINTKNNKDNLKNKNVGNRKDGKQTMKDINSKSDKIITKNVKNNLNSIAKEDMGVDSKNKNLTKSDAKSKNINNVVTSKNTDKLKPNNNKNKVNNNETFTKSTDEKDSNKNENVNEEIKKNQNEKKNMKTKLNIDNVIASKKSKTELKNDKNFEKIQKISTNSEINKKNHISKDSNTEEIKSQNLMQRFSKPDSVANKPNIASKKKIISPKIMKNKTNISTKISVMKNVLSVSKQSDKNSTKIPQRIKSSEIKKNILRLSPRFIKKPSVKPKM
ncbi:unnamed protein product, partial [Brenthis ino]